MAAVSQLADFARRFRNPPGPGVEIVATPRYQLQVMPDFPIPGPNHATWIRCAAAEVEQVVREARALFAARRLRFVWILDQDATPEDLAERLQALGARPDPHGEYAAAMVLPAEAHVDAPELDGIEIVDALAGYESFEAAEQAADEAFGGVSFGSASLMDDARPRRYENYRSTRGRRMLLARVDGEPAGSASLSLYPPAGAMMNGGAVRPRFRGRGVYRALVAARMAMIRDAGAAGALVWGGDMSRPILERLGFQPVGWRRFLIDA